MNKLALSLFGMFVKDASAADHWSLQIPKKMGRNAALLGLGGYAGWKANSAVNDWALGNQIRRQQGQ